MRSKIVEHSELFLPPWRRRERSGQHSSGESPCMTGHHWKVCDAGQERANPLVKTPRQHQQSADACGVDLIDEVTRGVVVGGKRLFEQERFPCSSCTHGQVGLHSGRNAECDRVDFSQKLIERTDSPCAELATQSGGGIRPTGPDGFKAGLRASRKQWGVESSRPGTRTGQAYPHRDRLAGDGGHW